MTLSLCPKCGHEWAGDPCPNCGPHAIMTSAAALRANDPDETRGRALYRAKADTLASAQVNFAKRKVGIKLKDKP